MDLIEHARIEELPDGSWQATLPWFFDLKASSPNKEDLSDLLSQAMRLRMQSDPAAMGVFQTYITQNALAAQSTLLLDFWAVWCKPCLAMAPALSSFADEFQDRVKIHKIDQDQNRGIAERFDVKSIPTLILFKDGREAMRVVGSRTAESLREEIAPFLS